MIKVTKSASYQVELDESDMQQLILALGLAVDALEDMPAEQMETHPHTRFGAIAYTLRDAL